MTDSFREKTVIITGASSGLGSALARAFSKLGARLVLCSRNEEKLKETGRLCRKPGSSPVTVVGDVTNPGDCKRLVETAISSHGTIDYLIANAGVSMWARFEDVQDISIFGKIMETNYLGAVHCIYYALPHLRKSSGMIVAVSSIQGKIGVPLHTGYGASKHALQGFLASLRAELGGSGVDILTVLPHWVRGTQLRSNAFQKDGKAVATSPKQHSKASISLQECSKAILKAMQKRQAELVIPPKLKLLLWLNLISPKIVDFLVKGKVEQQTNGPSP